MSRFYSDHINIINQYLIKVLTVTHSNCTDYDVQLVDGPSPNEGRVLICINRVWGTLCISGIHYNDVGVICLELGYHRGIDINILLRRYYCNCLGGTVYISEFPNAAIDVILVTDIICSNTSTTLSDCTFSHFTKTSYCDSKSIAAIKCHSKLKNINGEHCFFMYIYRLYRWRYTDYSL